VIEECSKLNQHVQAAVVERGMNNMDEEFCFWVQICRL